MTAHSLIHSLSHSHTHIHGSTRLHTTRRSTTTNPRMRTQAEEIITAMKIYSARDSTRHLHSSHEAGHSAWLYCSLTAPFSSPSSFASPEPVLVPTAATSGTTSLFASVCQWLPLHGGRPRHEKHAQNEWNTRFWHFDGLLHEAVTMVIGHSGKCQKQRVYLWRRSRRVQGHLILLLFCVLFRSPVVSPQH